MPHPTSRLAVRFAGLELSSPIIAASAPPTESVAGMLACARAGAGAVVTKSVVDYNRGDWPNIPRRVLRERQKLWIQGSFASETLTLAEGEMMIAETRAACDIPIIGSVGVLDPNSDAAIETALRLIKAGASLIHFDLFYLPQPRCTDAMRTALSDLFRRARATLPAPFGPKFNIDLPAHWLVGWLTPLSIDCVFLLDSVRVPPPLGRDGAPLIDAWRGGLECSLFGDGWQKPITLQYARVLVDAGLPDICAGGGLRNADDVMESLLLGAAAAQVATPIIVHGYDWISRTNEQLERWLDDAQVSTVEAVRGLALRARDVQHPEHVLPLRAVINAEACNPCGVCTTLAFCPFISGAPGGVPRIDSACYGCGLCEQLCPHEGAIVMEPA